MSQTEPTLQQQLELAFKAQNDQMARALGEITQRIARLETTTSSDTSGGKRSKVSDDILPMAMGSTTIPVVLTNPDVRPAALVTKEVEQKAKALHQSNMVTREKPTSAEYHIAYMLKVNELALNQDLRGIQQLTSSYVAKAEMAKKFGWNYIKYYEQLDHPAHPFGTADSVREAFKLKSALKGLKDSDKSSFRSGSGKKKGGNYRKKSTQDGGSMSAKGGAPKPPRKGGKGAN